MADYVSSHTGAQIDAAVDNATKVTANPTLAGTEASLTGLEVGSTKYKVTDPSGTYLPLAGGTMTGNINIDNNNIVHGQYNIISAGGGEIAIGNSTDTPTIWTPSNKDIKHKKGNYSYEMLDAANTSANPTLDGTEANLTSLKLNGTKYAIPSGGGHLYQHTVTLVRDGTVSNITTLFAIISVYNTSSTALTASDIESMIKAADTSGKFAISEGYVKPVNETTYYPVVYCNKFDNQFAAVYYLSSTDGMLFKSLKFEELLVQSDTVTQIF